MMDSPSYMLSKIAEKDNLTVYELFLVLIIQECMVILAMYLK
ncbi:hypothetical protein [Thermoanaerobacter sp. RKWS2]|nr:hypothetical protein [Thermoanaerobacter sp. RKWS2]UZQ83059.1 hypothetical protein OEI98_000048 [Thermoanaerobacter sp. RKWS2]